MQKMKTSLAAATFVCLVPAVLAASEETQQWLRGLQQQKHNQPRKLATTCTSVRLDFEEFPSGQYVTNTDLASYGVQIQLTTPNTAQCDITAPAIFDTQNPGCVKDLAGSTGDGKAIVIHDKSDTCRSSECCSAGGAVIFTWNVPVLLKDTALRLMDVGTQMNVYVQVQGNTDYTKLPDPPIVGNGKHVDYNITMADVIAMKVVFTGCGAIPFVQWQVCPRNPTGWGDPHFNVSASGMYSYHCDEFYLLSVPHSHARLLVYRSFNPTDLEWTQVRLPWCMRSPADAQ
jgi:hypothetical protein